MKDTSLPNIFDATALKKEFPALNQKIAGKDLVYLDNGATTQKPQSVIDAVAGYYKTINSNVHRGVHTLSQRATDALEASREKVRAFINARSVSEIIFTRGTTEAINLAATSLSSFLKEGDEILVSRMEHHSNIVPWQLAAQRTGAKVVEIPITQKGEIDMDAFHGLLSDKTRIVSVTHVSNVLGTVNPVKEITSMAHAAAAIVLVDGAQGVPHMKVDVQDIGCDLYAFSGHKMYGPTGIGVLYGREELLEKMPPYQGGGDMIKEVKFTGSTWADLPFKFEAGTVNIEGAINLSRAIDFMNRMDIQNVSKHEHMLLDYASQKMGTVLGLTVYGNATDKSGVFSFNVEGVHPSDLGTLLDQQGVAVRTGHHCAQPLMDFYGIPGTVRASFALYNTKEDIDALYDATLKAVSMLK